MPDVLFSAAARKDNRRLASSEMLLRTLELDWSQTELGPIDGWSEALKNTVRLVLSAPAPLAVLAGETGILIYNDSIKTIFSGIGSQGLGRPVTEVLSDAAGFYRDVISACAAGEAPSFRDVALKVARNGGAETAWFDLEFTPLLDGDGGHYAVLVHAFETTEKVRARRALERSEERLHLALDASGMIGVWDYDIGRDRVMVDERFMTLFGVKDGQDPKGVPLSAFMERIDVADRARVVGEIDDAIRTGGEFRSQYRVADGEGLVRSVLASGRVVKDAAGHAVRLPGVAVEVTAQVEAIEALMVSEARFRSLAETIPQIIWSSDGDGQHDYFSSRWYDFTGFDPARPDYDAWRELIHPDDRERVFDAWAHSQSTGAPYEIEYRFRHQSGVHRWLLVMAVSQRDEEGRIRRWFGTSTDIHEAKLITVEREIIAHELHHRIKNLFSVFNALVNLSARSAPDMATCVAELNGRILALSQAHDLVRPTSASTSEQTLHALVHRLLSPYADVLGPRLTCEGRDAPLGEGAATAFALVFHELATNAAKYGALSTPEGRVRLTTRVENDRLQVTWAETVKTMEGATPTLAASGFGSRLLALMVEGQLHGVLERRLEADGLMVEIGVPMRSLAHDR